MPDAPHVFAGRHLAQLNVARMVAPLDSPVMAGFVAKITEFNALADRSPGYATYLKSGLTTGFRPFYPKSGVCR